MSSNEILIKIGELKAQLKDYEERKQLFAPDKGLGIDNNSSYDKLISYVKADIQALESQYIQLEG